ncbi:MAG: multidrug efflux SMR transporter [Gammaproteobacteria bacterium]|nr:multidrug efflux SMR transporter [Gammaproteobacteria bacterium]
MTPVSKARSAAWIYLLIAGAAEIAFTYFLKASESFTKLGPTLAFVALSAVSFWLLTLAMRRITLGTAYAIWTGIGAFGTAIVGILAFGDPVTGARVTLILVIIGAVIGLKLVSKE